MTAVHYEFHDHIAQIMLNRPPVDALSLSMLEDIIAAFRRAGADDDVRAVVLASANFTVFCAGT